MRKNTSSRDGIEKRQRKWHTKNAHHAQEIIQKMMAAGGVLFESNKRDKCLSANNQNIKDMKLKIGMKVYCCLCSIAQEHTITQLFEDRGFAGIDNDFYWPINSCFPCDSVELPNKRG